MRNVALIVVLLWGFMFHSSQAFNVNIDVESDYRESDGKTHKIPCGATTRFKVTVSGTFDSTGDFEFEWKFADSKADVQRRRLLEVFDQSTKPVRLTGNEDEAFSYSFPLDLRCNDECEPDGFRPWLSTVTITSGNNVAHYEFFPSCSKDVAPPYPLQVELAGGLIDLNCGEERSFTAKVTGGFDDDENFDYDWTVYDIDVGGTDDKLDEGQQPTISGEKGTKAEAYTNFVIACTEFDGSTCFVAGSVGDVVGEDSYQASEIQFRASRGSELAQSAPGDLVVNCVPPDSHPLTVTLPEGPVMIPCGEKETLTATVSGPSDAFGHMQFSWEAYDYDEDPKTHVFLKNDILDANKSLASALNPFDLATADVPFSLECSRRGVLLGSGPGEVLPAEVFFRVTVIGGITARNPSVLPVYCEQCDEKLKPLALRGPSVIACGDKGDFELDVEGITDEGYTPRLMYGWYAYNTEGTKEMLLVQKLESTNGPSPNTVIQHTAKFSLECDSDCKFVDGSSLASIKVYAYQDPNNVPYLTLVKPEKVRCGKKESPDKLQLGSACKKTKECEKGLKCKGKKGDKKCGKKKKNG